MGGINNTVTKKDIIDRIRARTGLRHSDVKIIVQEFLDEIVQEIGEGKRLEFRDFGVFEVRTRAARTAQNPKTLEPVPVPEKNAVKFKPGRRMREALDQIDMQNGSIAAIMPEVKVTGHSSDGVADRSGASARR